MEDIGITFFVIEFSGKHVFYKLSRMWDVIENHDVTNLHVLFVLYEMICVAITPKSLKAVVTSSHIM